MATALALIALSSHTHPTHGPIMRAPIGAQSAQGAATESRRPLRSAATRMLQAWHTNRVCNTCDGWRPPLGLGLALFEQAARDADGSATPDESSAADAERTLDVLRADEAWLHSAADPLEVAAGHADLAARMAAAIDTLTVVHDAAMSEKA